MNRQCGSCSMCCKVPAIPELDKPANTWCQHCTPGRGCKISNDRPQLCKSYECLWLYGEDIPDWMKPNESKVILDIQSEDQFDGVVTGERRHAIRAMVSSAYRSVLEPGPKRGSVWSPLVTQCL